MNWSKIKDILIALLLVVTLFLVINMSVTRFVSTALPKGTGENFQTVLKNNEISLEKRQMPKYYEERKTLDARFYALDELAEIFIGERVNYTSQGTSIIAATGNKKLIITGKSFEYSSGKVSVGSDGDDILRAINKIGLNSEGAVYIKDEGLVRVYVDSIPVEGVFLDVSLDKNGNISHIKGVWPKIEVSGTDNKVSIISVTDEICKILPQNSHINLIEKVYVTESLNNDCVISPGWKIYADGKVYIIG